MNKRKNTTILFIFLCVVCLCLSSCRTDSEKTSKDDMINSFINTIQETNSDQIISYISANERPPYIFIRVYCESDSTELHNNVYNEIKSSYQNYSFESQSEFISTSYWTVYIEFREKERNQYVEKRTITIRTEHFPLTSETIDKAILP